MNKIICLVAVVFTAVVAHADISMPKEQNAYDKLGRGIANIALAPAEILDSPFSYLETEGSTVAFSKGLVQGFGRAGSDIALGLFDVLTFPFPIGPGGSYQTYKSPPWDSMVVQEYPPADLKYFY